MDILPDLNIILDAHIFSRKGHVTAKMCIECIEQNKWNMWISASSVDNLLYTLLNEGKRARINRDWLEIEFRKFMEKAKLFTVSAGSVRESLAIRDIEDYIIYTNFKRIAPKGILVSNDREFLEMPDVITPEEFIEKNKHPHTPPFISKAIPLLDLREEYRYMLEDIDNAVLKNIARAKYILGPEVKELEDKIAEYIGVKHCVGVSSGTEALVLSLRALAIKLKREEYWNRDDLIITTPFSFTATGDAILRAGATPLFVDIDPFTYNIDPQRIRHALTSLPSADKVVGIIPVHLYGQSCQMDEIMKIAEEYGLFVVEDVAQAFGGVWNGSAGSPQRLGSIGTTGCFSFFPSKPLGGYGDGGMVVTDDDEIAELVRMLLRHGGKDKYNVDHIGYNARLDTLQAAVLLAKFKYIDEFNDRRRKIAEIYNRELTEAVGIVLPKSYELSAMSHELYHVYHQYTVRVKNGKRDELQKYLKEKGISAMVYYPFPLHKMKVFEGKGKMWERLDGAEEATQSVLSLPIEPLQSEADTAYIIDCLKGHFLH